ncbi:spermatid-specific manchette-related protein 1 isoform X1 [Perognathus longimembris pacificus]|uniref:spermatid-specific manchette-related protein 1 isoform X1 n=1 Tax=Perognathus longimembris pacificus TaxID=214514 RepID=UPI0020187B40|nr:spermatid-specific manchette-related protein 1 isoform X1 [Perognathus longimembris pacificus]
MFLFSRKTKTPISTYSDSFRAPTSIKEVYKDPPLWAWEANKFLTRGLTNAMQHHVDPNAVQMDKCATQDYPYKSSLSGHPYFPEKYWFSQEEEDKYCPSYLGGYRYNSWKMGPYNNPYWSKYSSYLPRLSNKDTGVDAVVRGMPLEYPPKPERLNAYEREVVMNMLNSLSRSQPLPQIAPRCGCLDPLPGRLPFQGFDSPCSGRHYCLRGLDCYTAVSPCTERPLSPLCLEEPTVRTVSPFGHRPGMQCVVTPPLPSYYPFPNLRWDTSHFKKTGGPQRNSYVVHPEFVSENYPRYRCW